MECVKCKNSIPEGSTFCSFCGTKIKGPVDPESQSKITGKSLMFLAVIFGWNIFTSLFFLIFNWIFHSPIADSFDGLIDYEDFNIISNFFTILFFVVSLTLGIIFTILAKKKLARGILIAYISVEFLLLLNFLLVRFVL